MSYWIKPPWWLKAYYSELVWQMPDEDAVYLTFDDGPHPSITTYVLDELKKANAKATFFCIGKNVDAHVEIYERIIAEGHTTGNHTQNHMNGWKNKSHDYIANVDLASHHIKSNLFRPPYGRIRKKQIKKLQQKATPYRIYMWDVLSADFDKYISPQRCLDNVLNNIKPGSIIVFHDSEKAWERMSYALPKVLSHCNINKWQMKPLPNR